MDGFLLDADEYFTQHGERQSKTSDPIIPSIPLDQDIIDQIDELVQELTIAGLSFLGEEQILEYKGQKISLSDIADEGTYEPNIRLWIASVDEDWDNLAEEIG